MKIVQGCLKDKLGKYMNEISENMKTDDNSASQELNESKDASPKDDNDN